MAFHVHKEVGWSYGTGQPPYKYSVEVTLDCAIISQTSTTATFSLTGWVGVACNPNSTTIPWRASDYGVLSIGTNDPIQYPFNAGTDYFQRTLPFIPNAPSSYTDAVLIEFRGDIYQGSSPHSVSLYVKGQGLVLPTTSETGVKSYHIDTTFTLPLTGNPSQNVLIWNNSYCNSQTDYHWDQHQVWASMFDFDYRPGMSWDGSAYMSHNREGGVCNIWDGSSWQEMRTENSPTGKGNPPLIFRDGDWYNQAKIGQE